MLYRAAVTNDVPALARIRAAEWGGEAYWENRISGYLAGMLNPQHALAPRSCYVAFAENNQNSIVGFAAGHLTRRHACHG